MVTATWQSAPLGTTTDRRTKEQPSSITVVPQDHAGPAVARNAGIQASSGEFVAFLDSDDLYMPEKLARCVEVFQARPEVGVGYTAVRIRELDTGLCYELPQYTHDGDMARDLFVECRGVNTSTLVVRRACLDEVGGFDEDFFRAQDWDLMVRLAEVTHYARIAEMLTERRLHARSLSVTHAHLYRKYNLMVLERAVARRPDLYDDLKGRAFGLAYLRFGLQHYSAFRMVEARGEFRAALTHAFSWRAFSYWLRTFLPRGVVRCLRRIRMAFQFSGRGKARTEDRRV